MSKPPDKRLIDHFVPLAVVLSFVVVVFLTISPFLPALLWGVVLAIAIDPSFRWLVEKVSGRRLLAAWVTAVLLAIIFIIPALGLARALLDFVPEALSWFERLAAANTHEPPGGLKDLPAIGPQILALWQDLMTDASKAFARFQAEIKGAFLWFLAEAEVLGIFVLEFAIGILFAVIFVYRGDSLTGHVDRFLHRVGGRFAQDVAAHSVTTARQTVRGVLGAALVQTLVAVVSYLIVGVPNWMILAGITFLLALIQIGPFLVFIPLSIWLWADGHVWQAAFVFLWGIVVVNTVDNIVRPMIASKDSNLPASLAFLGALGGLAEWGVLGVFLGPVILAVGYEVVMKWIESDKAKEQTSSRVGLE